MKLHLKHSINLCLIVSALILTSCGKKENKVNSTAGLTTQISSSNPLFSSASGTTIVNQVNSIKANMACLNGYRLANDVNFYVQGGIVGANRIGGNWIEGFMPSTSGQVNKMWIGVSAYRDLMFVTQVMNGSQVAGFNVTLSFCEMKNASANTPSVISNERALTNFITPNGIVVSSTATCGYNVVSLSQQTYITSQRDLNNPYSPLAVQVPTSFAPPRCN